MKVAFLIRMNEELKKWYENKSKEIGITTTSLIIQALRMYKEFEEEKNKKES